MLRLHCCFVAVLLWAAGAGFVALPGQDQTLPRGFSDGNGGVETRLPFSGTADQTWQWHYAASEFSSTTPIHIDRIAVRGHAHREVGTFDFASLEIVMASSPTSYARPGLNGRPAHSATFAQNLSADARVVRSARPFQGLGRIGRWVFIDLDTPFQYNPQGGQDFVIQVRLCGVIDPFDAPIFAVQASAGTLGGNRYGALTSCNASQENFANADLVPVLQIDWHPVNATTRWQVNHPAATLSLDDELGTPFRPAIVRRCPGDFSVARFESTQLGFPWEGLVTLNPPVPLQGGGASLSDGQIVNCNLLDPTVFYQFGGAFPSFTSATWMSDLDLPFQVDSLFASSGLQLIVVDPAAAPLIRLSAVAYVQKVSSAPVQGPTGDEELLTVFLGRSPLCGPGEVRFYGRNFSEVQFSSNGRILFGGGSPDFSPTVSEALNGAPFAGLWCDLDPSLGGRFEVTSPSPTSVRFSALAVPYFGVAQSQNSYFVEIDGISGTIEIGGLSQIDAHPLTAPVSAQFLGLSAGQGRAQNALPSLFAPTLTGSALTPFALLYDFWDGLGTGPGNTTDARLLSLQSGADAILYTPLATGGYSWVAI